jgi:hypothetical protein
MATKKTATKPQPKRARQKNLPTMENVSIPALDDATDSYVSARDHRMKLTKEECDTRDNLIALMVENRLTVYEFNGFTVNLLSKQKVSVKRAGEDEGDSE